MISIPCNRSIVYLIARYSLREKNTYSVNKENNTSVNTHDYKILNRSNRYPYFSEENLFSQVHGFEKCDIHIKCYIIQGFQRFLYLFSFLSLVSLVCYAWASSLNLGRVGATLCVVFGLLIVISSCCRARALCAQLQ